MRSMTEYAAVFKKKDSHAIQLILRSLNFKYLDIVIHNLPHQNILLEEKIKKLIKRDIVRGKIEVYVFVKGSLANEIHIEESNFAKYVTESKRLAKKYGLNPQLTVVDFLNLPQVISWKETPGEETLIISAVKEGLAKLIEFKQREGTIIRKEVQKNLSKLKENVRIIAANKPQARDQNNEKEDIDEEISLMSFYINKLEKNIHAKNTAYKGKSMDFLTQEILRELNAASSKTKNQTIAYLIVEAKSYLERIREQAQNVE
jgi:uncharacterized protein YicC (UPF0701 family)